MSATVSGHGINMYCSKSGSFAIMLHRNIVSSGWHLVLILSTQWSQDQACRFCDSADVKQIVRTPVGETLRNDISLSFAAIQGAAGLYLGGTTASDLTPPHDFVQTANSP